MSTQLSDKQAATTLAHRAVLELVAGSGYLTLATQIMKNDPDDDDGAKDEVIVALDALEAVVRLAAQATMNRVFGPDFASVFFNDAANVIVEEVSTNASGMLNYLEEHDELVPQMSTRGTYVIPVED